MVRKKNVSYFVEKFNTGKVLYICYIEYIYILNEIITIQIMRNKIIEITRRKYT